MTLADLTYTQFGFLVLFAVGAVYFVIKMIQLAKESHIADGPRK